MTHDEIVLAAIGVVVCVPTALFWAAKICFRAALNAIVDEGDLG